MKINHITNPEPVAKKDVRSATVKESENKSDSTDFTIIKTLQSALKNQPEIRLSKVAEANEKTSSLQYPPEELMKGISRLIAEHLSWSER